MAGCADPVRLEVMKNALEGIADGMAVTLVRTSRSTVVRVSLDFSTAVLDARGQLVGQGLCTPIHLGGMMPALEACLTYYKDDVRPGDVLINNDPYEGGSHLPDIFLFKPIFIEATLIGYLCCMSHQIDIGGRVAGGNACDNSEIYQEGLRIPPLKLYEEGRRNDTLFRILEKAVRVPDKVIGDITGQVAALKFGETELRALVGRIGIAEFGRETTELVDYTETLTRKAISRLPDGSWRFSDRIDDDGFGHGPLEIVANVCKRADRIEVDFTGTAPQAKGSFNPPFASTKGIVCAVLKTVLSTVTTDIPNTAGYFRPISVYAPEGCILNPVPPAPVAARSLTLRRMSHALFGAFAQMLPRSVPGCPGGSEYGVAIAGYDKRTNPWKPWVCMDFANETASGGRYGQDGADAQNAGITNIANVPIEVIEVEYPVRIEAYGLVPDSEGAGEYRGGLALERCYRFLADDTTVQVRSDRQRSAPYGVAGGQSSRPAVIAVYSKDGEQRMPSKFLRTLQSGDGMRAEWPGAGGWGDPLDRDPERVRQDCREEKISLQRARDVYGVVIDAHDATVDVAATRKLRDQLKRARESSAPAAQRQSDLRAGGQ